jgi:hypothetical protein
MHCGTQQHEQAHAQQASKYGLERGEISAIAAYHEQDTRGLTLENFLTTVLGCQTDGENSAIARAKMGELGHAINYPEAAREREAYEASPDFKHWQEAHDLEVKWDLAVKAEPSLERKLQQGLGRTPADSDALFAMIANLGDVLSNESAMYPQRRNETAAAVNAYGEGIIYSDERCGKVDFDEKIRELLQTCLVVAHLKFDGFANTKDADKQATYSLWRGKQDQAQTDAIAYINSLPDPSKQIAANYMRMQLGLAAQDEQAMATRDIASYGKNGYENQFIARMFFNAPAMECNWYKRLTPKGGYQTHFILAKTHKNIADELNCYCVSYDIQTPSFPAPVLGMTSAPQPAGDAPPFQLSQALIDQLAPKTTAALAAFDAMGVASSLTAIPTDDTFVANVAELAKPFTDGIKQPDHIEVDGMEMSLGRLEADLEGWQAKYDTLGDTSEEQGIKLQMYQERRAKFFEMLSNLMKKVSETSSTIVGNLK